MSWLVKAETHRGSILVLKSGFETEDAALDGFKVKAKYYRRVWVEEANLPSLWHRLKNRPAPPPPRPG